MGIVAKKEGFLEDDAGAAEGVEKRFGSRSTTMLVSAITIFSQGPLYG